MPRRRHKHYYVVLEAKHLTVPTIFLDWEKAQAIVNKGKAVFKGFYSFQDAEQYLEANGIRDYKVDRAPYEDEFNNQHTGSRLYAVSQGRSPGVFPCYFDGAQGQVDGFSGACHKSYATAKQCLRAVETSREARTHREHLDEMFDLMNVMHH